MNSKLLPVLNDTKLQSSNNALYQFLKQLLDFIGSSGSSLGGSSGGGSSSGGGIQSKVISITHAQILTLPSTPVTLITGPASGSRIKVIALSAINKFSVAAYTGVDPVICTLKIATPADQWISILTNDNTIPLSNVTNFLGNLNNILVDFIIPYVQSNFYVYPNDPAFPGGNAIDWSGADILLGFDNNGSVVDLGGGDPSNTIQITIYYTIEKL